MDNQKVWKQLFVVAFVIIVIGGVWMGIKIHRSYYSFMLVSVALITYFGFLMLPGGFDKKTGFTESRIRLAIASTLVLTYLVYFCIVIFWASSGEGQKTRYNENLLHTLTDLLKIVLPFYFGATAVSEIVQRRNNRLTNDSQNESSKRKND